MSLSASYRPLVSPLRADGIPKASRNAWCLDADTSKYKRLTVAVRAEIAGTDH
jgi:putative long chain acyl-CoA synthase